MAAITLAEAVSAYGVSLRPKLANPAIGGQPEDQLRAPLELLVKDLARAGSLQGDVQLVGETSLADIKTRPDFAATVDSALVGFIEVKAPGKGADPRHFTSQHDKDQWNKLKSLPNLLYTDGQSFSLWRDGAIVGKVVALDGDIESAGAKLAAPDALLPLILDFLTWEPIRPSNAKRLAEITARLCRLLRDEVIEQLARNSEGLTALKHDWRKLLFPEANDEQFADGYAQAVTFGLLIARALDIPLAGGIHQAAHELRKTNSLIGTALGLLTDDEANQKALETSLKTLTRVLDTVNWHTISKDRPDAWLYFYEDFLDVYDKKLRRQTGSYYTPPEVVDAMARLVDEVLRGPLFERPAGLASADVTLADPAMGTGTFLLGVLRRIADTVAKDQGAGAVPGAIKAAAKRLVGFELQFGPFAVAQLRLVAEMQALARPKSGEVAAMPEMRLFITNTLGDPFVEEETLGRIYESVAQSKRAANRVKAEERITVVLGNPPYKNQARDKGDWIERGSSGRPAPMEWWSPPRDWGIGAHTHHLKNLYVYFWRWATLKVFGSGWEDATGKQIDDRYGIVCFITAAGFLNGPGFQKMREELRRDCSDIWVIDCSPEGHQPDVPTRIFQGVQQPVCIVLAVRPADKERKEPARVRYFTLPRGRRDVKLKALGDLSLEYSGWRGGASEWRSAFLPEKSGEWATFPLLAEFFLWSSPGVKTHRTWVIAPDSESLPQRWDALRHESIIEKKENLFHPDRDRYLEKVVSVGLGTHGVRSITVAKDEGPVVEPCRYGFRSFDRQWIVPDHRLLSMARPELWSCYSSREIYLTALEAHSPTSGPATTFACLVPDQHHYKGSFGGRVYPLWRDAAAKTPNIPPKLLAELALAYGQPVSAEDVMAYLAAVLAHPAFTARFQPDLVQPGLRVPLTADPALFNEAVGLGREVIWLHTYGERFADPAAGRPKGPPRMPEGQRPFIPEDGGIPGAPEPLPDTMDYDAARRRLSVGKGFVDNVSPEMWTYEVSGKQVVWHWFSYRRRDRTRPQIGDKRPPSPLDRIQPDHWLHEYTTDLIDLLNVLGGVVALEPRQAALLERILEAELIKADHLRVALGEVGKGN
ncbi:type ISP restriction/modification enzyme [Mesorhizobium sp. LHD-90]|uniref:type ISP restriction/modification enzyme n=1 Tax=Mesorhizobium sp. LHD-90 TaxID=3071414 RepID=UPI0027E0FD62|nr:type ISP restriction/modification enzyme [Mesorhizobium sp. LHD-90]MDQ6436526.1 type ISP restriction/modification enzyme [Mesorhizobium sp. LHD-90]